MAHNEGLDGDALVQTVITLCTQRFKVRLPAAPVRLKPALPSGWPHPASGYVQSSFNLDLSEDWVLELDSSTAAKFSRHVIIALPGAAFQSNAHVGAFVRDMTARPAPGSGEGCEGQGSAESCGSSGSQPWPELLVNKVRPWCWSQLLFGGHASLAGVVLRGNGTWYLNRTARATRRCS